MLYKFALLVLACTVTLVAGNPAVGVEWRWEPRHPTVTPNVMSLPFNKLVETFVPMVHIPGYKTVPNCGPVKANTRIVGGSESTPHAYPWQVALYIDDRYFCGGSIINEEWIMTAAHCMDGANKVEVVAGAHNLQINEATQVSQFSTNFFVHENWGSFTLKNDISLIRLSTHLRWTSAIKPVCLPSYSSPDLRTGTMVNPSGWGKSSDSAGGVASRLRDVYVPIDSHTHCASIYGGVVTNNVICIDSTGGKGTCNGDSGGPMNYIDGGKTTTRGIVSFGSSAGCEQGYPDAFTRVTDYLSWIETKTGIAINR